MQSVNKEIPFFAVNLLSKQKPSPAELQRVFFLNTSSSKHIFIRNWQTRGKQAGVGIVFPSNFIVELWSVTTPSFGRYVTGNAQLNAINSFMSDASSKKFYKEANSLQFQRLLACSSASEGSLSAQTWANV